MKFKERLLHGTLIKRYKRFFVDIKYQNKTIIAQGLDPPLILRLLLTFLTGSMTWYKPYERYRIKRVS